MTKNTVGALSRQRKSMQNMEHVTDPKDDLLKSLGDLSGVEVFGRNILVVTYVRPHKTAGGVLLPDAHRKEDEYQGKVGLIIKVGPDAFENDPDIKCTLGAKIGDWVTYRHADGVARSINGVHCRNLPWEYLLEKIDHPDRIM